MSNLMIASFGNKLFANVLRKGILPSIGNQLLNKSNTNRAHIEWIQLNRCINTSKAKKDDLPSYTPGLMDGQPKGPQTVKEFADVESQKV